MHTYDFIVIGAGQAGLAAGYYLQQAEQRFLLLDAHARVGDSWRNRWEGLRLFSPQRYNALPGLPPPGDPWHLPDRLEVATYLEGYAEHFGFPVRSHCTCLRATRVADNWLLETTLGTFSSRRLIVATGAYRTPSIPRELAAEFPPRIRQYHAAEIRSVADVVDASTSVLVVGAGASGQQLARLALATGAEVLLAGPNLPNLPRTLLGRDTYWWLYRSGLMTLRSDRFPGKYLRGGDGDVTVGEARLSEVRRYATEVSGYSNEKLTFRCRKTVPRPVPWPTFGRRGVVLWCTGYANTYPFLPADALDDTGQPRHTAGLSDRLPGLAFLGLPHLLRSNSSLIGGVGEDARRVVGQLMTES
ncbi:MAG: NAD(P)-binding domain-containing protein [Bacteroidota bacterium]